MYVLDFHRLVFFLLYMVIKSSQKSQQRLLELNMIFMILTSISCQFMFIVEC